MSQFIIMALVGPVGKEVNDYMGTVPESTARRRIRKSLARTDALLAEFPLIREISRNPTSGLVTIFGDEDIGGLLAERGFSFIPIKEGRSIRAEERRRFSVRGMKGVSQERIVHLVETELGGIPAAGIGMFLIPTPVERYVSAMEKQVPPWLAVMNEIQKILDKNEIQAVVGIH